MIRHLHRILLPALLIVAVLCSPALAQEKSPFSAPKKPDTLPPKPEGQKYRDPLMARCVFVTDGDTIKVRIGEQIENIRLIGVNAPERKDEGWKAARDFVSELCFDKDVRIEFDKVERDRYKRILGYVFVPVAGGEDIFVNGELLAKGHAEYYGYKATDRYSERLKAIECENEAAPSLAAPSIIKPIAGSREEQMVFFAVVFGVDRIQREFRSSINTIDSEDPAQVYDWYRRLAKIMGLLRYEMENTEVPQLFPDPNIQKGVEQWWYIYYSAIGTLENVGLVVVADFEMKRATTWYEVYGMASDANENIDIAADRLVLAAVILEFTDEEVEAILVKSKSMW